MANLYCGVLLDAQIMINVTVNKVFQLKINILAKIIEQL